MRAVPGPALPVLAQPAGLPPSINTQEVETAAVTSVATYADGRLLRRGVGKVGGAVVGLTDETLRI
jgi:hypothetical protein